MKKLCLGLALIAVSFACKSQDSARVEDASSAEAPAACSDCGSADACSDCSTATECPAAAAECPASTKECSEGAQVCPVTGAKVEQ